MTTVPSGLPAWSRTADHTIYGGHTSKRNYLSEGVVNAETDVGAEDLCRLAEDLAAVVRTAKYCVMSITGREATADPPLVNFAAMMTGVTSAPYDGDTPPTGFPTVASAGSGEYTITWPAAPTDAYGTAQALVLQVAGINIEYEAGAGAARLGYAQVTGSGEEVSIEVFTLAGAGKEDATFTVWVA